MNYTTTKTRKTYIGKERDDESYLGDFGVRKYDYAAGRFTSPDVLWEKYMGCSPYNYCMNNPISLLDANGRNAGMRVDEVNKILTIEAVYVYNDFKDNSKVDIERAEEALNKANYSVSEGDYKGFNVTFNLTAIPLSSGADANEFNCSDENGRPISVGNTYETDAQFHWEDRNKIKHDFNVKPNGRVTGGVTLDCWQIVMNPPYNSLKNRTHEIFHTLFFSNDGATSGIGSDKEDQMPLQEDINNMVKQQGIIQ